MMKCAILIDDWKYPVFKEMLEAENYSFILGDGLTPRTRNLFVTIDGFDPSKLGDLVQRANEEASKRKPELISNITV